MSSPLSHLTLGSNETNRSSSDGKPRAQLEKSFENGPQQAPPDVPLPARNLPTPAIHSAAQFPTIPSTMANAASQPAPVSPFGCPPGQPSVKPAPLFSLSPETGDVPFGSHTSQTTSAGQIFGRSPASQAGVIGNRSTSNPNRTSYYVLPDDVSNICPLRPRPTNQRPADLRSSENLSILRRKGKHARQAAVCPETSG